MLSSFTKKQNHPSEIRIPVLNLRDTITSANCNRFVVLLLVLKSCLVYQVDASYTWLWHPVTSQWILKKWFWNCHLNVKKRHSVALMTRENDGWWTRNLLWNSPGVHHLRLCLQKMFEYYSDHKCTSTWFLCLVLGYIIVKGGCRYIKKIPLPCWQICIFSHTTWGMWV